MQENLPVDVEDDMQVEELVLDSRTFLVRTK